MSAKLTFREEEIPLDKIDAHPDNPRKTTAQDEDQKLSQSLLLHGLLCAILVTMQSGRYVLVDGHRRTSTARKLGWKTIRAVVVQENLTPAERQTLMVILNLRRADLNPMDRSDAFKAIQDQFSYNLTQLAEALSEDHATISKSLRLQSLIPELKEALRQERLGFVEAYKLSCRLPEEQRKRLKQDEATTGSGVAKKCNAISVTKRVVLPLGSGITITISGSSLSMEDVLLSLEYVLKEARKNKAKNIDVSTLGKIMQDQVKQIREAS